MAIKNVVHVGAAGSLGKVVLDKLSASEFDITVLRRQGSKTTSPDGIKVIEADFDSVSSLTSALQGVDAIVSTIGSAALPLQKNIIDAAVASGVQRFIPSEFGSDLDIPAVRKSPVFLPKVQVQDYLIEKAKTTSLTYTPVSNNVFLDWGLENGFIISLRNGKPSIISPGDNLFSATTLGSVADAVVGIMRHPEETKNRTVYIEDVKTSQNRLLELAKQIVPEKSFEVTYLDIDEQVAESDRRLKQGLFDMQTWAPYLQQACIASKTASFQKTDNELLGLKPKTEQDIVDILTRVLKE